MSLTIEEIRAAADVARRRVSAMSWSERRKLLERARQAMREGPKHKTKVLTLEQWEVLKAKWRHPRTTNFRQEPGSKIPARTADRPAVRPVMAPQADTTPDKEKAAW